MAFRTWGRLLLTALGVSVLAGAGQLGVAYGFGVVRLDGAFTDGPVDRWPAQLAWVGWFAAVAAVTGAVLTARLAHRDASPGGTAEQLAIAGAAALGAIVVAPLCMQPARAAELDGTVDPVWAVGICAILGAVVGAGIAIVVLLRTPFGWSIALTATIVWLLALVSAAPSMASAGAPPTVRLGVLEPSWLDPAAAQRLAMLILPTVCLLAGAAVGALARRRGHLPLVGGAAGAAGPVLLAFSYLTAGPGDPADRYQVAPYYGALIAVAAGALGSTATTLLRRPAADMETMAAIAPTDILQPLPTSLAVAATADTSAGGPSLVDRADTATPSDEPATGGVPASADPTSVDGPVTDGRPGDRPMTERDSLTRRLPVPGLLPTGRRTSAIDVLASGPPAGVVVPAPDPVPIERPAPTSLEVDRPLAVATEPEAAPAPAEDGDRAAPTGGETTPPGDEPADTGASGDRRGATPRFSADGGQPVELARPADGAASPRPRIPIFEEETDQPRRVRPAWPLAPAPSWPVAPRATGPTGTDDTPANDGRPEPAPRPRNRALPDLGRGAGWDAFAPSRPAIPQRTSPPATPAEGETVEPATTGSPTAEQPTPDPGGTKSRLRRGLFRRNRARDAEVVEADHEPEALAEQDEDYVGWVAGLASDAVAEDPRTLRTGRHHRD